MFIGNLPGLNEAIHMAATELAYIRELSYNKLLSPAMLISLRPSSNLFK